VRRASSVEAGVITWPSPASRDVRLCVTRTGLATLTAVAAATDLRHHTPITSVTPPPRNRHAVGLEASCEEPPASRRPKGTRDLVVSQKYGVTRRSQASPLSSAALRNLPKLSEIE
jgi:hypothetical protein